MMPADAAFPSKILSNAGPASEDAMWDDFVATSPQGSDWLTSTVLTKLARTMAPAAEPLRLVLLDPGQRWQAAWGVLVRRRWGIRYASSFPLF